MYCKKNQIYVNLIIKIVVAAHITVNKEHQCIVLRVTTQTDDNAATLSTVWQMINTGATIIHYCVQCNGKLHIDDEDKSALCKLLQVTQNCVSVHSKTDENTAPLH